MWLSYIFFFYFLLFSFKMRRTICLTLKKVGTKKETLEEKRRVTEKSQLRNQVPSE